MSSENHPSPAAESGGNGSAADFAPLQRLALLSGAIGLGVYAVVGISQASLGDGGGTRQFFLSFLVAWVFWLSLPLGGMALLGIHYITGSSWGMLWRRFLEAATRTLPLLALLFIPLAASLYSEKASPYIWTQGAEKVAHNEAQAEELKHKFDDWLNVPFFLGRVVLYFVLWLGLVYLLNTWAAKGEKDKDPTVRRKSENLAGPLLMIFGIGCMFASTDFVMSLELSWSSTMFPVIYGVNQLLTTITFCVALTMTLSTRSPFAEKMRPKFQIDMGTLMLALTMVWSYTNFSQFMLIWVGNLPEEIPYYLKRSRGGWEYVAYALILFHFACPFLLLLFRDVKLHRQRLRAVAIGIMIMCAIDVLWWIEPAVSHEGMPFFWVMDIAAIVGMGGIWFWYFLMQLKKQPLLPTNEIHLLPGAEHAH